MATQEPIKVTQGQTIQERIRAPSPKLGYLIATIYGRGGVGKTSLLGTMPGKGLVIDIPVIEGGTMVLSEHADRIGVIQVTRWEEFDEIYKFLRPGTTEYKWVAIDTITAAQQLAKRKAVQQRELSADPHQTTMQDWGKIGNLMAELFYRFNQLPMHVLLLSQEKLKETGEGGTAEYQPDISPASLSALTPAMFLVGRMYVREVDDPAHPGLQVTERRLRVGTSTTAVTKVRTLRSRPLPAVIREPDLGQIFRYMLGAENAIEPEAAAEEQVFAVVS